MNRKQAGIILTLLALIICTGILASKVNGEFKNLDGLTTLSNKENNTSSTDFFYESRSVREQNDDRTINNLKAIIADENTTEDNKNAAQEELTVKTMTMDAESRIELSVRSKGFEDALCSIDDQTAKVIVKNDEALTQEQMNEIQDIVMNVSKIYDVTIESK